MTSNVEFDRYTNFVPNLQGRYLSSNVNITVFNSEGKAVSVPVGSKCFLLVFQAMKHFS